MNAELHDLYDKIDLLLRVFPELDLLKTKTLIQIYRFMDEDKLSAAAQGPTTENRRHK